MSILNLVMSGLILSLLVGGKTITFEKKIDFKKFLENNPEASYMWGGSPATPDHLQQVPGECKCADNQLQGQRNGAENALHPKPCSLRVC